MSLWAGVKRVQKLTGSFYNPLTSCTELYVLDMHSSQNDRKHLVLISEHLQTNAASETLFLHSCFCLPADYEKRKRFLL